MSSIPSSAIYPSNVGPHSKPASDLSFSSGPAAANAYLKADGKTSTLTFDWSYDSLYFQLGTGGWVTIDLNNPSVGDLDTSEKKSVFKSLLVYMISETKGDTSQVVQKQMENLTSLVDLLS
jgi:hypothetical protein